MKHTIVALLFSAVAVTSAMTQDMSSYRGPDDAFWAAHWAGPRIALFGADEQQFYDNVQDVVFPWNEHDEPSNLSVLDKNAQWLKEHAAVQFYVEGYASTRGELLYNLRLSQRRADWVKQALVMRGIPESRILLSVGWGQLYPVCPETNDQCWTKNRLVRLTFFSSSSQTARNNY